MRTNRTAFSLELGAVVALLLAISSAVELRAQTPGAASEERVSAAASERPVSSPGGVDRDAGRDADRDTVASATSVGELLESDPAATVTGSRSRPGLTSTFLRLLGWTIAVLALGAAVAFVLKRYTPVGRSFDGGGLVRVLGRTALSPRHSIVLVRVGNQRVLVVGVSGDRMVTLSEIGDPAGILACDDAFRTSLESEMGARGFDGDVDRGADRNGDGDTGLLPYQRELGKIRRLIGNWRGMLQGTLGGAETHGVRRAGAAAGDVEAERPI